MSTAEETTAEMPQEANGRAQLIIASATLVFSSCTVVVNPLTLLAMGMHGLIRKNSINMHIASLCLSDFLMGLSAIPFMLLRLTQANHQEVITWTASFLFTTGSIMSSANAFLIGIDRACATLAAHSYKSLMTTRRAAVDLLAVWSLAIAIPAACGFATAQLNSGFETLTYPHELLPAKFLSYIGTPMTIVNTLIIAILYTVIVVAFYKSSRKIHPSSTFEIRNRRITRTVTMVIVMLLLSNIPVIVVIIMQTSFGLGSSNAEYFYSYRMLYDIAFLLVIIPTSCNNCIYVWQLQDFKKALIKLMFCRHNSTIHVANACVQ
ncbi:hypothetical protein CAPTEDRAFT_205793 [Capitella teleta]|uniref:G-protein coupled receptors family 1 profile domain-containing protein n=1 Tax=Capitella teleta TaxID=283909 RepID=R7U4C4_CAPTE|nr:hypothetical protein CAPTEDRAFT_205793 [Capitella teleta]|eukprot:ELU01215.1 hypothetical protein CAPTEDRAFT_205793 [Capitella teleta]